MTEIFSVQRAVNFGAGKTQVQADFLEAESMMSKPSISGNVRRGTRAFTLVEVLISAGILAFMMLSLYTAFTLGFASIETTREELRATQLMMQKVEAIRLCTWNQLSNCPGTFTANYNPLPTTNGSAGALYSGTLVTTGAATNIPDSASYKNKVHLITVTVTWTNFIGNNKIIHTRQMQTLAAYYGMQNYIYGYTNQ
jgi:type II secretory pathway pseudopilin PulG